MKNEKEPIGIIFILKKDDKNSDIEEKLKPHFKLIVENLVDEGLIVAKEEFDRILDGEMVHFVRLEDSDFKKLNESEELIGATAIDVYKTFHGIQPNEDVEVIHYDGKKSPWKFDLYVCIVYSY